MGKRTTLKRRARRKGKRKGACEIDEEAAFRCAQLLFMLIVDGICLSKSNNRRPSHLRNDASGFCSFPASGLCDAALPAGSNSPYIEFKTQNTKDKDDWKQLVARARARSWYLRFCFEYENAVWVWLGKYTMAVVGPSGSAVIARTGHLLCCDVVCFLLARVSPFPCRFSRCSFPGLWYAP